MESHELARPAPSFNRELAESAMPKQLGPYAILEQISTGATSVTYRGHDTALGRPVAVKMLRTEFAANEAKARTFQLQAVQAAKASHPNLVAIHFVGIEASQVFFAMQYVEGESVASCLRRQRILPLQSAIDIISQVIEGLDAIHRQGLVHGRLRPSHILLEHETDRVLVTGFGPAGSVEESASAQTSLLTRESLAYLAPEQAEGQPPTVQSDLYAVGVILHEMLMGGLPELAAASASLAPRDSNECEDVAGPALDIPYAVRGVLAKLTARNPGERYASAAAIKADLDAARTRQRPVNSCEIPLPAPPKRLGQRIAPLLLVFLGLVAVYGVQRLYLDRSPPRNPQLEEAARRAIEQVEEEQRKRDAKILKAPPARLLTDVIAYFTFEPETVQRAGEMTLVKDLSGHNHHGVLVRAKTADTGKVGYGLVCSGAEGSCLRVPTLPRAWLNSVDPVSVSVWANETRYHKESTVFASADGDGRASGAKLCRLASERTYGYFTPSKGGVRSREELGDLQWHHVVGMWDGRAIKLFFDGKPCERTLQWTSGEGDFSRFLQGFGAVVGQGFEGTVDEVVVFRRNLFPDEVASLYEMGSQGKRPPPPVANPPVTPFLAALEKTRTEEERTFNELVAARRKALRVRSHDQELAAYAFIPDGTMTVVGHYWGWIYQQTWTSMKQPDVVRAQPFGCRLYGLALSPDRGRVACYGASGEVYFWEIAKAAVTGKIVTPLKEILSVDFSADSRRVVVAGRKNPSDAAGGAVALWEVASTGKELWRYAKASSDVSAVASSPDGSRVVAASTDGQFHLLRADNGEQTRSFPAHSDVTTCLQFLPDGKQVLSGSRDKTLRLWDVETGRQIHELRGHIGEITCLDVFPGGRLAISGSADGSVRLWDLTQARTVERVAVNEGAVRGVKFSENPPGFFWGTAYGETQQYLLNQIMDNLEDKRPAAKR